MRAVLVAIAACLACAPTVAAERAPKFPNRTPYAEARQSMIALGWQPVPQKYQCDDDDERCAGRPETIDCSSTGLARCSFMWRRADTLVEIHTAGETRPFVTGVRCRVNCR